MDFAAHVDLLLLIPDRISSRIAHGDVARHSIAFSADRWVGCPHFMHKVAIGFGSMPNPVRWSKNQITEGIIKTEEILAKVVTSPRETISRLRLYGRFQETPDFEPVGQTRGWLPSILINASGVYQVPVTV